jgi:hypothetical protein
VLLSILIFDLYEERQTVHAAIQHLPDSASQKRRQTNRLEASALLVGIIPTVRSANACFCDPSELAVADKGQPRYMTTLLPAIFASLFFSLNQFSGLVPFAPIPTSHFCSVTLFPLPSASVPHPSIPLALFFLSQVFFLI